LRDDSVYLKKKIKDFMSRKKLR